MTIHPVELDLGHEGPDPVYEALLTAGIGDTGTSLEQLLARPAWHALAACRGVGPETFYIDKGGDYRPAYDLCANCPVTAECADAGQRERFGVWGGLPTRQRRRRPTAEDPQLDTSA